MTTPTTVQVRLQIRADTATNWVSANSVLLANELGLETDTKKFKIGDGATAWNGLPYFPSIVSGGTVLGNLEIGSTGTLTFEGSTADAFETTLGVVNPTADRTILLPDASGTVVVGGSASIVDADIAPNAEIAVSKLANGTANQVLVTDGTDVSWSDDLTLAGDLTVNGTTTTINTQDLLVKDKNIELAVVDTPTDVTADGGGITLRGTTNKTINWIDATDAWTSSERFSVPLGSASLPSLTFTGDENSGLYSPGADQVAVATNGTGRLFIDASGNIGHKSTPASWDPDSGLSAIQLNGYGAIWNYYNNVQLAFNTYQSSTGDKYLTTDEAAKYTLDSGGNHVWYTASSGSANAAVTFSERVRITNAGLVGIGTSSPSTKLEVSDGSITAGSSGDVLIGRNSSSFPSPGAGYFKLGTNNLDGSNGGLSIFTLASDSFQERVRVDSSGRVGIGTTSPGLTLDIKAATDGLLRVNNSNESSHGSADARIVAGGTYYQNPVIVGSSIKFNTYNGSSEGERLRIDSSGRLLVGTASSSGNYLLEVNGAIKDSAGSIRSVPQNSQTASYTLVATDTGKHISITTGGVTVPASVFSVGDIVTIYNNSGSNQTITQGASTTLRQAGTANTGNRTLAQYGVATMLCVASNTFVISGAGLS